MRSTVSSSAVFVLLAAAACVGTLPPPPELTVTSPQRGLVQGQPGRVMVTGTALPGPSGDPVARVTVNDVTAKLAADGSFTAEVDMQAGASLLETVAISQAGAKSTDARAVQVGELRPVGTNIDRAVTAAVSADAFARLSTAAGPLIKTMNVGAMLASLQPIAKYGDSIANLAVTVTKVTFGDVKITLTPVDGGLQFSAQLTALNVNANAVYAGSLVPDGTTAVTATADQVTIAGTLAVTPAGTAGFTTTLASPVIRTTGLKLAASGLAGTILDLLQSNLESTIQRVATSTAERAMQPMINKAFGALAGPQQVDVRGKKVEFQASPSAVQFSRAGALVTMNLAVKLEGSETSPGFVFTPNGTPTMTMTSGIQLGLADDLLNEMLAEIHALHLLDIHLDPKALGLDQQNFDLFDAADFKLTLPPMIGANNTDGTLRLVLGDMVATFSNQGKKVMGAAVNAQIDLAILRGSSPEQIMLKFGKVHAFVNLLDDAENGDVDLSGATGAGIGIQLDKLSEFLITMPLPSVAGVSLDNLSLRADSGYVIASGQIH